MKHITILCSLLLGLLNLAGADDKPEPANGDKHILQIALTVVIEDDLGDFHQLGPEKLKGLEVKFGDSIGVIEEISNGKQHKLNKGQNLLVIALPANSPDGMHDLSVSHPTFGSEIIKWSLSENRRPEFRLELLQN